MSSNTHRYLVEQVVSHLGHDRVDILFCQICRHSVRFSNSLYGYCEVGLMRVLYGCDLNVKMIQLETCAEVKSSLLGMSWCTFEASETKGWSHLSEADGHHS